MSDGGHLTLQTTHVELEEAYTALHPEVKPGPYVLLIVSDDGLGMSEEIKAHLFEPFFTTKELGKGTGLGLAAVYGIIKQSDGYITVYSEVDQGTTFRIYLPRLEAFFSPLEPSIETITALPGGNETILLAEDDPRVRELARNMLADQGYTVLEAGNGPEALQLANNYPGPIHLLLTDVVMPGMNGKTLAVELSQRRPGRKFSLCPVTLTIRSHHGVLELTLLFT
jgi:CheY-like chemotaxis protein